MPTVQLSTVAGEIEESGRTVVERIARSLEQVSQGSGPEMAFAASYPRWFDAADLTERMEVPLGMAVELAT